MFDTGFVTASQMKGRVMYQKWRDQQGFHPQKPGWDDLSIGEQAEWIKKAEDADGLDSHPAAPGEPRNRAERRAMRRGR